MSDKITSMIIKFNESDNHGDVFVNGCISIDRLKKTKTTIHVEEIEVDDSGVKIVKKATLKSVSI